MQPKRHVSRAVHHPARRANRRNPVQRLHDLQSITPASNAELWLGFCTAKFPKLNVGSSILLARFGHKPLSLLK